MKNTFGLDGDQIKGSKTQFDRARAIATGKSPSLSKLGDALLAIDYLMAQGGFVECSKAEFAWTMGWTLGTGRDEKPDRRRVEDVCNLTRDQELFPEYGAALGGFVIAYAPSQGGMSLVDPTGEIPLHHLVHILLGDMQKQQAAKTINRRRQPTWRTAGDSATVNGDVELARLFYQAENEIATTGFVSDSVVGSCFKVARSRGLFESEAK